MPLSKSRSGSGRTAQWVFKNSATAAARGGRFATARGFATARSFAAAVAATVEQAFQLAEDAALARSAARFAASRSFATAARFSSATAGRFSRTAARFSSTTARGFSGTTARSFAAARGAAAIAMEQTLQAAQQAAAGAAAARIAADGFAADRLTADGFAAATAATTEQAHATERTGVGRKGSSNRRQTTRDDGTLQHTPEKMGGGETPSSHTHVWCRGHGPTQGFAASSTSSDSQTVTAVIALPLEYDIVDPAGPTSPTARIFLKFPRLPARNNPRMLAAPAERAANGGADCNGTPSPKRSPPNECGKPLVFRLHFGHKRDKTSAQSATLPHCQQQAVRIRRFAVKHAVSRK